MIKDVKILRRNDGSHKGSGFVQYHDVPSAERAIHFIDGKYVLNAPGFPQQRPVYMKFASVGGGGLGGGGGLELQNLEILLFFATSNAFLLYFYFFYFHCYCIAFRVSRSPRTLL